MTECTQSQTRCARKGLTAEILRSLVRYDAEAGIFIRLAAPKRSAGKAENKPAAAYKNDNGYVLISLGRSWRFRAHQLAWLYMTGEWPLSDIDHINGDRADNRWQNLRAATRIQNLQNASIRSDNTSGLKGVSWDNPRGLWKAQICINKKRKFIGRYPTKQQAHEAYRAAAEQHFGEFARTA